MLSTQEKIDWLEFLLENHLKRIREGFGSYSLCLLANDITSGNNRRFNLKHIDWMKLELYDTNESFTILYDRCNTKVINRKGAFKYFSNLFHWRTDDHESRTKWLIERISKYKSELCTTEV